MFLFNRHPDKAFHAPTIAIPREVEYMMHLERAFSTSDMRGHLANLASLRRSPLNSEAAAQHYYQCVYPLLLNLASELMLTVGDPVIEILSPERSDLAVYDRRIRPKYDGMGDMSESLRMIYKPFAQIRLILAKYRAPFVGMIEQLISINEVQLALCLLLYAQKIGLQLAPGTVHRVTQKNIINAPSEVAIYAMRLAIDAAGEVFVDYLRQGLHLDITGKRSVDVQQRIRGIMVYVLAGFGEMSHDVIDHLGIDAQVKIMILSEIFAGSKYLSNADEVGQKALFGLSIINKIEPAFKYEIVAQKISYLKRAKLES